MNDEWNDWNLVILRTEKGALLRPLMLCDITLKYEAGMNDEMVLQFLESGPQSRADLEAFVSKRWTDPNDVLFGIYVDQLPIGNIRLHDIDQAEATIGICIYDKSMWGKGWATDAIKRVVQFASEQIGITKIKANMKRENARSVRAFVKAGFTQIEDDQKGNHQTRWSKA